MNQHCPSGLFGEPSAVRHRFGLAGAEVMPLTVNPEFNPCMIVIRMCPAGSVDLPCGNANSPEG